MTHTHTHRIMLFMFSPKAIATKCKGQVSKTLERNREIRKKKQNNKFYSILRVSRFMFHLFSPFSGTQLLKWQNVVLRVSFDTWRKRTWKQVWLAFIFFSHNQSHNKTKDEKVKKNQSMIRKRMVWKENCTFRSIVFLPFLTIYLQSHF